MTGTVYATTVVRTGEGAPRNLCLVDRDDGVRVLTTVRGPAPEAVRIGLRVTEVPGTSPPAWEAAA